LHRTGGKKKRKKQDSSQRSKPDSLKQIRGHTKVRESGEAGTSIGSKMHAIAHHTATIITTQGDITSRGKWAKGSLARVQSLMCNHQLNKECPIPDGVEKIRLNSTHHKVITASLFRRDTTCPIRKITLTNQSNPSTLPEGGSIQPEAQQGNGKGWVKRTVKKAKRAKHNELNWKGGLGQPTLLEIVQTSERARANKKNTWIVPPFSQHKPGLEIDSEKHECEARACHS